MVSRKRSKGKERKTKQAEKEAKELRSKCRVYWQSLVRGFGCDHGFGCIIPHDNHPVSSFMDDFWVNWFCKDYSGVLAAGRDASNGIKNC